MVGRALVEPDPAESGGQRRGHAGHGGGAECGQALIAGERFVEAPRVHGARCFTCERQGLRIGAEGARRSRRVDQRASRPGLDPAAMEGQHQSAVAYERFGFGRVDERPSKQLLPARQPPLHGGRENGCAPVAPFC